MMERLTYRDANGECWYCGNATPADRLHRLAAYEDTRLEPREVLGLCEMDSRARLANLLRLEEYQELGTIDHLRELVQAEQDGRLVVLSPPAKEGDPKGLFGKYIVRKASDGTLIDNCFVLRPEKDPAAITAIRAYAEVTDNSTLATDLSQWVGEEKPLMLEELAKAYLEICDDECVGDDSVGVPCCQFYEWPDLDDDEHPCPGECRLNAYRHKLKEENRV